MFQPYSATFTTLDKLRRTCPHLSIFRQIQAYSESWHSKTCILRHMQNPWLALGYSEPPTYLASLRHYSRSIHVYSEPYLSRFRHIQDPGIVASNNVKQHQLFKSVFSLKSLFRSIWNSFSFLFQN